MKPYVLLGLLALATGVGARANAIDDEVSKLDKNGMWMNGMFRSIPLPATARPEQVLAEILPKTWRGDQNNADQFRDYHVAEIRKVNLPGDMLTHSQAYGALIVSARGSQTIILMQYQGSGWWNRTDFVTTVP